MGNSQANKTCHSGKQDLSLRKFNSVQFSSIQFRKKN